MDSPVLTTTIPQNGSLNFEGNEIVLEFDEYVKEENLITQLLITPRIDGTYKTRVNRNRVILSFEEEFDSATTYTLNFREGIKDITEGNVPDNLNFVFSTGDFLDSASISGSVRSLMSKEQQEDITISLYQTEDSITVFNGPPLYSTKTNEQGLFSIQNVKYGNYYLYAIKDENQNLQLESRDEAYGFLPDSILLSDSLTDANLELQYLDTREIVLQNSRPVGNNFDFKFNKYLVRYQLLDPEIPLKSNLVERNNTLRIYKNELVTDSLALHIEVEDSLSQKLDTTIYIRFESSERKPADFSGSLKLTNGPVDRIIKTSIKLNKPVASINYDSIYFRFDSLGSIPISADHISLGYSEDLLDFNINLDSIFAQDTLLLSWDSKFEFVLAAGGIISIEQDTLGKLVREISLKLPEEHGLLAGTINTIYPSFILQLLDKDFEVIEEQKFQEVENAATYRFRNITPGDYSFRILVDQNLNGRWDPGNMLEAILPEPVKVYFHPNVGSAVLTVRANWEQTDINLVID